jgi:hypothetical protein
MGAAQSNKNDTETIGWNNIKTDNMSSTRPKIHKLSKDALQLISSLSIPQNTETETTESISNIINNLHNDNKLFEKISNNNNDELSATSPFITSEMYNYLVNNVTSESENVMKGGAKKQTAKKSKAKPSKKRGGALDDDSSSTSSTSDASSTDDILGDSDNKKDTKKKKEEHKKKESKKEESEETEESDKSDKSDKSSSSEEEEESVGGSNLSYLSSSAHTGGDLSESKNSTDDSTQTTENSSSESENKRSQSTESSYKGNYLDTSSIKTENINMVSSEN